MRPAGVQVVDEEGNPLDIALDADALGATVGAEPSSSTDNADQAADTAEGTQT